MFDSSSPLPESISSRIRFKARQLTGRYGYGIDEQDDLVQRISLEVIRKRGRVNPSRASHPAFLWQLIENAVASILEHDRAQCRDRRNVSSRLDDRIPDGLDGWCSPADMTTEDSIRAHQGIDPRSEQESLELRLDVETVLADLPDDLRDLCRRLRSESLTRISRETGVPRGTLYDAVARIRRRFVEAGLQEYLRDDRRFGPPAGR